MQLDSLQTDSLIRPDSIIVAAPADSALQIPDSGILLANDSISIIKDSTGTRLIENTLVKIKKTESAVKDSLVKKTGFPQSLTDTIQAPSFIDSSLAVSDTLKDSLIPSGMASDTSLSATAQSTSQEGQLTYLIRNEQGNFWVVTIFLLIFALLAWVKVSYSKRIKQFFEAFLSNRNIRQMVREEFVFSHPTSIALSIIFLLTASLFLTQADSYFGWNIFGDGAVKGPGGILVFINFLFFLTLFYGIKIMLIRLSASLLEAGGAITEYLFNLFLFNNILGILLFPLVMLVVFARSLSPQSIILAGGGLVLLAFLFRLVKCFYLGNMSTNFSKSYIILYICTLEILPLFFVIKTFAGRN